MARGVLVRSIMLKMFLVLALAVPQVHATDCVTLLLRHGMGLVQAVRGKEYMEEGRPPREQLIARGKATPDQIARAWATRDDRSKIVWAPRVDYWGPSEFTVALLPRIPGWLDMTNAQLRPLVNIENAIAMEQHEFGFGDGEEDAEMYRQYVTGLGLEPRDLENWRRLFPDRPISEKLRRLIVSR